MFINNNVKNDLLTYAKVNMKEDEDIAKELQN